MELDFGTEFDTFREEVRAFIKGNWPPADGNLKSHENERTFVMAGVDRRFSVRGETANATPMGP